MLRLAYFAELTWLVVDMLSGYLQNHGIFLPGNQTFSSVVRVGILVLFLAIVLRHSKRKRMILAILLMCFAWVTVHAISYSLSGEGSVLADVQFHLKLFLPILLVSVLEVQFRRGALDCDKVRSIVLLNATVLIFNLSLGLFGIGFGNYGESDSGELLGSKGFFYAGNEVSATLVAIFALIVFAYRNQFQRNVLLLLTVIAVFFIASLMSLSKTSLLGFLLVLLFVMYNYLSLTRKIKFGVMLAATAIITAPFWLSLLQVAIERWEYFWELRSDFLDFITSGRTERIEQYVAWLTGADTPWPWIFGVGQVHGDAAASFENDLLDLTYGSGLLGLLFYGLWLGWAASGLYVWVRHRRPEGAFTLYMVSIFIFLSIVAGHVIYSATLAPFIALLALTSSRHFPGNVVTFSRRTSHP